MIKLRLKRDAIGRIVTDESGSAMVLALAFLIFFAFVGAALLAFVDTAFRGSLAVKDQRRTSYAGDGGIEGAIRYLQADPTGVRGRSESECDFITTLNGATVTVRCTPYAGSGDAILGGADAPEYAVLTLDDNLGSPGFTKGPGGGPAILFVNGNVFSNSKIEVNNGAISVTGTASARGGCDAGVTATVALSCSVTTVEDDPKYPPGATTFSPVTTVTCVATQVTATFSPGKYTSTPEALIDANPACSSKASEVFLPGIYYFEFLSNWEPTNRTIRVGFDPLTNLCPFGTPGTGAQFIFAGDSSWRLKNGTDLKMCGYTPASGGQRIAIYGAGNGLFTSQNSADVNIRVSGTVYAPASKVDIGIGNSCSQLFDRGIIAWQVSVRLVACNPPSPISLPPTGVIGYQARQVLLEAFVGCPPGGAGCNPKVRAKVRFPVIPPASPPIIDYWTVLRG